MYEEYVWSYEEYENMNCTKNMKTGIVRRICMKLWRIWRQELYEEYVWSYEEYEDRNCMKNTYKVMKNMKTGIMKNMYEGMYEYEKMNYMKNTYKVMMNMKTGIVWRICMKVW